MPQEPFTAQAKTLPISATSTASSSTALPAKGASLRVVNEGPNIAFISVGSGAQTAALPNSTPTATSTPCPVGDVTLTIPSNAVLNISAICRANQTAALSVQVGEGS